MKSKIISFVVSETARIGKGGEAVETKPIQSAPPYYEAALPKQFLLSEETATINGRALKFFIKSYHPDILLVETVAEVDDVFSRETFKLREQLVDHCHKIVKARGGKSGLNEEYSIAVLYDYQGDPEQFFGRKMEIAAFLKSEREPLDEKEIEYTLSSQIKYAKDDLVIVDWDGAFVFDTTGEVDDIIDLLQTANLQLLRYRALDEELSSRLRKVTKFAQAPSAKLPFFSLSHREVLKALRVVIESRAKAISDFEALDKDIKLIGDWYSARFYELISKKFKLEEWRRSIQYKLDALEDIYTIVSENFSVSSHQLLELVQIFLFFILQAGWFTLIILEFFYFTR